MLLPLGKSFWAQLVHYETAFCCRVLYREKILQHKVILLYSFIIIVIFLQQRKQIVESRKYCFVLWWFIYFFVYIRVGIQLNSLHQHLPKSKTPLFQPFSLTSTSTGWCGCLVFNFFACIRHRLYLVAENLRISKRQKA